MAFKDVKPINAILSRQKEKLPFFKWIKLLWEQTFQGLVCANCSLKAVYLTQIASAQTTDCNTINTFFHCFFLFVFYQNWTLTLCVWPVRSSIHICNLQTWWEAKFPSVLQCGAAEHMLSNSSSREYWQPHSLVGRTNGCFIHRQSSKPLVDLVDLEDPVVRMTLTDWLEEEGRKSTTIVIQNKPHSKQQTWSWRTSSKSRSQSF